MAPGSLAFALTIRLDTEHMRSGDDVQRALALTGAELANRFDGLTLPEHLTGTIHDSTGASVGSWAVTHDDTQEIRS